MIWKPDIMSKKYVSQVFQASFLKDYFKKKKPAQVQKKRENAIFFDDILFFSPKKAIK